MPSLLPLQRSLIHLFGLLELTLSAAEYA
jgi:hypothetical protein